MNDRSPPQVKDPSAIRELLRSGQLAWRLISDSRVSWSLKLIPFLALVYFVSPIDLVPDFIIPGFGSLDDLAVMAIALRFFIRLAPPELVREHSGRGAAVASDDETISADYRVNDAA